MSLLLTTTATNIFIQVFGEANSSRSNKGKSLLNYIYYVIIIQLLIYIWKQKKYIFVVYLIYLFNLFV